MLWILLIPMLSTWPRQGRRLGTRELVCLYPTSGRKPYDAEPAFRLSFLLRDYTDEPRDAAYVVEHVTQSELLKAPSASPSPPNLVLYQDLESSALPRICLALDYIITTPSEEVIPAVETRLRGLLAHDQSVFSCALAMLNRSNYFSSSQVKRKALHAFGALSSFDLTILEQVQSIVMRCLKDTDRSVVGAALALLRRHFVQVGHFWDLGIP